MGHRLYCAKIEKEKQELIIRKLNENQSKNLPNKLTGLKGSSCSETEKIRKKLLSVKNFSGIRTLFESLYTKYYAEIRLSFVVIENFLHLCSKMYA